MASRLVFRGIALLALACSLAGCGYFQGNVSDGDGEFDDLVLEGEEVNRSSGAAKTAGFEKSAADETPIQGDLGLRLSVGNRFPLQKTVHQRLTQPSERGDSTGHSRLDLLLSLNVEELRDGHIRFGVRYHRVGYLEQDPEGRTVEYNSMAPPREIPAQVRVYAGLINNGFSFWIGPDNRIVELVGFNDFVQRCVRDVPPAQRDSVIAQLTADKGENGIASFIDDSIGLLPVSGDPKSSRIPVQEGTAWDLPDRRIDGPIPMQVSTQCKIKGLSERTAEIDLFGTVRPTGQIEQPEGWKVSVLGGRCLGSCTVDRTTGLPTDSRVERYVDLLMELPDGSQLKQRKQIITSIHAFLDQENNLASGQTIRPLSHSEPAPATSEPKTAGKKSRSSTDDLKLFR